MKAIINIKADKDVKKKAQKIAEELGLPLSTIINAYLKEFTRSREIRFSVEPQLRSEIGKLLEKARQDYRNKKNIAGPFRGSQVMDRYLDS